MKHILFFSLLFPAIVLAADIKSIDFFQDGEVSRVEVSLSDSGVKVKKFHVVEDKQIILDLENVEAIPRVLRAFDTSEFSGTVIFVSPYRKPGTTNDIRVAIQLRDNARSLVETEGNKIILSIENRFGAFSQYKIKENEATSEKAANGEIVSSLNIPKSDSIEDILENLTLSGPKKYIGKKTSLNVKDVPIAEILKMISDTSGFNIILDQEVLKVPNVTLNLTNIPWDQILDTILNISKLVAQKNGNILLVTTLAKATQEKELEIKALEQAKKQEILVTKIFPISYATLVDIQKIVEGYITKDRGSIASDERTNSLIIKDTVEVMDRVRKIIEVLDTQTPQILIESKIVEVTEDYRKDIGLQNGIQFGYDPIGSVNAGNNPVGTTQSTPENSAFSGPGFTFASAPAAGLNFMNLQVGQWSRLLNLNLSLQLLEQESKVKIISSPRVITQNKKQATISSQDSTNFAQTSTNQETGVALQTFESVSANLNLQVTPQVTNEGAIAMDIQVNKTDLAPPPAPGFPPNTNQRTVNTNVLVDNGSTIVIGGIYRMSSDLTHSGIPFLKDIPLIGWLFRTSYRPSTFRSEMVIFLTPRIINQEEAGLVDRESLL